MTRPSGPSGRRRCAYPGRRQRLASGVRKDNLIRYVHWRDADMPYTYVDSNYEVRGTGWETFFAWLKDHVEQNA